MNGEYLSVANFIIPTRCPTQMPIFKVDKFLCLIIDWSKKFDDINFKEKSQFNKILNKFKKN